ncbi:MAG: trypsin-like peptidase domain-containing protein [Myxococcales bacterium]|nr:trypsin-like peptidase domain-containing protein [Myxococcales bacterium]
MLLGGLAAALETPQPAQALCTPPYGPGSADSCNIRVSCLLDELPERRAVAKIRAPSIAGMVAGSGVLVNNGYGIEGAPYLLTAAHLLDYDGNGDVTEAEANNFAIQAEFAFGLEADCGGGSVAEPYVVQGATVLSEDEGFDLVLLQLDIASADLIAHADPYFVGWNLDDDPLPLHVHTIHHPCCDTKMISGGESPMDFNGYTALGGLTCGGLQDGSSGAPLFDTATGNLIGLFSGILTDGAPAAGGNLCAGESASLVFGPFSDFAFPYLGAQTAVPPFDPGP